MKYFAINLTVKQGFALFMVFVLQVNLSLAQDLIERKETDEKFANTTIIYKSREANDSAILSEFDAMNGSAGLGEIVRITTAPPKPKPAVASEEVFVQKENTRPAVKNVSNTIRVLPENTTVKATQRKPNTVVKATAPTKKATIEGGYPNRTDGGSSYSVSKKAGKSAYWNKKQRRTLMRGVKKNYKITPKKGKVRCPKF